MTVEVEQQYPESAYCDYARFALDRACAGGVSPKAGLPERDKPAEIRELGQLTPGFAYGPGASDPLGKL